MHDKGRYRAFVSRGRSTWLNLQEASSRPHCLSRKGRRPSLRKGTRKQFSKPENSFQGSPLTHSLPTLAVSRGNFVNPMPIMKTTQRNADTERGSIVRSRWSSRGSL